jgi:putative hydrolase
VSEPSSSFSGEPLQDLLRNLARLLTNQGPLNWEVANQLAMWTATEGQAEANPDPLARIRLEELLRVADMHVAEVTGLPTSRKGWLSLRCVTRSEWATRALDLWKPVLLSLASSLTAGSEASNAEAGTPSPMDQLLGNLPQVIGPLALGAQAGAMVGHLAGRAMGQYDLPMPAPQDDVLMAVPEAIDSFAKEWALEPDDLRMWICLRDVAHHAVLSRPHVGKALEDHLLAYTGAFHLDATVIEERLSHLDPTDPASFQEAFGDPGTLLGQAQSEEQRALLVRAEALLAALAGYTDHIVDSVGQRLVGSYGLVTEALRRRRLEDGPGQQVLGKLLGIELGPATIERGHAFVSGVVERAGEGVLARLWEKPAGLPTPAEVDAPGLWLARTEFDDA